MTYRALSPVLAACLLTLAGRTPAAAQLREAQVKCVYYRTEGKKKMGGTEDVTLRVGPNNSRVAVVSFPEDGAKSSREQWKTSAWVAAFCAARATDHLINDFEFHVIVRDQVDGPSAGMLLAATMIALINGETVQPNVTMTGTINPDGSIGPVGSIYYKLLGAHDSHLKVFGYPVGCRITIKEETGEPVDLQDEAARFGMQAVEVADMYEAYTLLTGKQLARPVALPESKMQISSRLAQQLRSATDLQVTDARQRLAPFPRRADKAPPELRDRLIAALNGIGYSQLFGERGNAMLSAVRAERAAVDARLVEIAARQKPGPLRALLDEAGRQERLADEQLRGVRSAFESKMTQQTVGGKLAAFDVCASYWQARSWVAACHSLCELLGKPPGGAAALSTEEATKLANLALEYTAMAQAKAASLPAAAENIRETGPKAVQTDEMFQRLGDAYRVTATFGMSWCTALLRASKNMPAGLSPWEEELFFCNQVEDFQPTTYLSQVALSRPLGGYGGMLPIDQLAAGNLAYAAAAGMINKRYNFEAAPGSSVIMNRKALSRSLDLARQRVLEDCSMLYRRLGAVPDCIAMHYEIANAWRDGADDEERLLALKRYSRCVFLCELARTLMPDRAPSLRPEPTFEKTEVGNKAVALPKTR